MTDDFLADSEPEAPIAAPSEEHSVFPALAEVHRRGGRPDEAEEVARRGLEFEPERAEGRVVLALALLDQDRVDEARGILTPVADRLLADHGIEAPVPGKSAREAPPRAEPVSGAAPAFEDAFTDDEIDLAFDDAEAERDQILDADQVAQQAMRQVDGFSDDLVSGVESPFATRTMADLLERQGDLERAGQIRAALEGGARMQPPPRDDRQQIIGELESWLENLRRDRP